MYTIEILSSLKLQEIKQIASDLETKPTEDAREKKNWIDAIVYAVAGAVPASAFDEPASPIKSPAEVLDLVEPALEDEEALKAQIDTACEAERQAILAGDSQEAERLDVLTTELLNRYQRAIGAQMDKLAREAMEICDEAAPVAVSPSVVWASDSTGTVSLDGGQTCRVFRLLGDWREQNPTIKLLTSTGEISSKWRTTKGNRFINAIRDDIAQRISKRLAAANIDLSQWVDGFTPQHDKGLVISYVYKPRE